MAAYTLLRAGGSGRDDGRGDIVSCLQQYRNEGNRLLKATSRAVFPRAINEKNIGTWTLPSIIIYLIRSHHLEYTQVS